MTIGHDNLLPGIAPPWARIMSEVIDPVAALADRYEDVRAADAVYPPQFLPWVVWQFGLGELTPYVPSLYQLIDEGIDWQRVRGTPRAIEMGLGWLGYTGALEENPVRRRRWNGFQIHLGRVRDEDRPDLERIYGVVSLSPPIRSKFTRGFRGYDVRACETGYKKTSGSLTSAHSGVRIDQVPAKWSFGRYYEHTRDLTQEDLTRCGAWLEPIPSELWVTQNVLWVNQNVLWSQPAIQGRRTLIASTIVEQGAFVRFRDAQGAVIGSARAVIRPVAPAVSNGDYVVAGQQYVTDLANCTALVVQATTGFGDGLGKEAASMSVVIGARIGSVAPYGARWIEPLPSYPSTMTAPTPRLTGFDDTLIGGAEIAQTPVAIEFGETVRERCRFLLRIV